MDLLKKAFSLETRRSPGRIDFPDIARGLAMLLVLAHHAGVPLGTKIAMFHMPLMFMLSGYTEHVADKPRQFSTYIKSKAKRLLVPYFAFEVLNLLIWIAIQLVNRQPVNIADALVGIAACVNNSYVGLYGRLWFLPCMFVSNIIFFALKTACKGKKIPLCLSATGLLVLSWAVTELIPFRLPFTVDIALMASAFIAVGYVSGSLIDSVLSGRWQLQAVLFLLAAAVFTLGALSGKAHCHMYINEYGDYPVTVLTALSGSAMFFFVSKWLCALLDKAAWLRKAVLWYGCNSLATFPAHLTVKVAVVAMFDLAGFHFWLILFLAMFIFNIPLVNLLTEYAPFMLGMKRTK